MLHHLHQESPRQTKPKKGPKRKVLEFAHFFVNSGVFLRKTSTIHISKFCSGMPLRKVHELTFLLVWFAGATPDCNSASRRQPLWDLFWRWGKCDLGGAISPCLSSKDTIRSSQPHRSKPSGKLNRAIE